MTKTDRSLLESISEDLRSKGKVPYQGTHKPSTLAGALSQPDGPLFPEREYATLPERNNLPI